MGHPYEWPTFHPLAFLPLWPVVLEDEGQVEMVVILDDAHDATPEAYISLFYPLRP